MSNYSTSELSEAYIALGANLGDREQSLKEALALLGAHAEIEVLRCSGIYETEPVGYADQPNFLNMTAAVRTSLLPEALLDVMLEIEDRLGRVRTIRNGPRTVDLDLLWMDGKVLDTPHLILPHPRMQERAFVLFPLRDIVPRDEPSGLWEIVTKALGKLDGREGIKLWTSSGWEDGFGHTGN
ncbi:2-amino-4-hydroxy-6-hydroxymethyldihydropteridine diphosphokinase [Paenibacillus forsythiae]|uniref:2-amino-4-hydroxy-6-hydroxymethyldihydropteridine diphosphokinase n=1 Tax=Paenibacillus forsythiae TaxID=365616 RepID=A0ABU3HE25_9BACL|nr:2-amino-4-hydroxy-6-hydroxymethyldihydropteridine diphosphokinase [Paenibacillus forsythiae]MDT3428731.1 2-amino-4-hydroxy-6-hydroxymethyldihydropteridine diphosphokinase [Paenibacillus forsythiae]